MYVTPKIIIFTKDKENFEKINEDYKNDKNTFYKCIRDIDLALAIVSFSCQGFALYWTYEVINL